MSRSEPKPLPTTIGFPTLGAWETGGVPLFARCKTCGREVCLMPRSYTMRFSRQTSFWRIMKRLRCTICRAPANIRRVPSGQVTPNFIQVFGRDAEAEVEVFDAMLSRADEAKASDGDYREKPRGGAYSSMRAITRLLQPVFSLEFIHGATE